MAKTDLDTLLWLLDRPVCPMCGSTKMSDSDFRDDLSRKEAEISWLCQTCQDSVFGAEVE